MNIAWAIVVAQIALLVATLLLLGLSLRTTESNRAKHCAYRKLGIFVVTLATVLAIPMLLLRSLVIGVADHLLVFGVPLATVAVGFVIIGRAKLQNHGHLQGK